jgi:predicted transcriptional regulator
MDDYKLGAVESRFAALIWDNEPLHSRELVALCQKELNWKKPTTYTVLRKLCERGIFQNVDGMVSSLLSRQEFYARQSEQFVQETFAGSLPAFLAAFTTRKTLSAREVSEIRQMIDSFGEE